MVFSSDCNIILVPSPAKERRAGHEKRHSGRHRLVVHSTAVFTAAIIILCHTSAHAPYPASASHIPATAPKKSPSELDAATMRTSIAFISRLVCTIADALKIMHRNITLAKGTRRISF